jgi:endo-1,4-beta-mannosidase
MKLPIIEKKNKTVSFNLDKNIIIEYERYFIKKNLKTRHILLYTFLYKNIKSEKMKKYLPNPTHETFFQILRFENYFIEIQYYLNKTQKICILINHNIQLPGFYSTYLNIDNNDETRFIIINYIRKICFNNNIY